MIIDEIKLYNYQLPFKKPLALKGKSLSQREGLLLEIKTVNGFIGYGDVAPLPGFSPESLTKAKLTLQKTKDNLEGTEIPSGLEKLNGGFAEWLADYQLPPSTQFGLEMAVLSLFAQKRKVSLAGLLGPHFHDTLLVNVLLIGSREEIIAQTRQLLSSGYRSFKLKVGHRSLAEDISLVQSLREIIYDKALLRLDANKAWSLDQAVHFFGQIGLDLVEYIEEPLANTDELSQFYQQSMIPIALDESIREEGLEKFRSVDGVELVVLKPTLTGGIEKTWMLAQEANQVGLQVVISSSFESGLGIYGLAHLAAHLSHHVAVGLETGSFFKNDLLVHPLMSKSGAFHIHQLPWENLKFQEGTFEHLAL